MEFEKQASNMNTHCYITAPTSPNELSRSSSMEFYYSAPASPLRNTATIDPTLNRSVTGPSLDDFEFETSKKFSGQLNFGPPKDDDFEYPASDDRGNKCRERGDSLPAMAFADELFLNGLVMPLKLPPRLQIEGDSNCSFSLNKSPVFSSSPKSPRTVCRIPFSRKNSWNDDFDPFLVALQRVREEKRGRNSHYRRSRSLSPFRAVSKCNQEDVPKDDTSMEPTPRVPAPSHSGPLDFKGSAYARWVRDQTREGLSPKSPRWLSFGQRVRPLRIEHDGSDKPTSLKGRSERKSSGNAENKVQKLKGFLLRYASFGRDNSGSKQIKTTSDVQKPSYFSRMSFKFKGNGQSKGKKMNSADTNMAVVEYKPSLALCLGYGVRAPGLSK